MVIHVSTDDLVSAAALMGNSMAAATVPLNVTRYISFGGTGLGLTEASAEIVAPRSGTLANLTVVTESAQPATGSLVIMIRKNRADTALTLTIAANAAAGMFSDNTHSVAVAQGDKIAIKLTNNAALLASAQINGISCVYK